MSCFIRNTFLRNSTQVLRKQRTTKQCLSTERTTKQCLSTETNQTISYKTIYFLSYKQICFEAPKFLNCPLYSEEPGKAFYSR